VEITAEGIAEIQKGSLPDELGIEPLELSEGVARGRLIIERRHLHPFGYVHGKTWVTLADTIAA